MRPLTLHTSALNDAEYALFTENLASLLDLDTDKDQAEFETQTLTVREVRAWMRGRYAGIPVATIDRILALFPCKDGMLTGGEFFAALRLVLHVEAGKDVDRALAFVQVHPGSAPAAVGPAAVEDTPAAPARTPQRHNPFLSAQPPSSTLTRSKTSPAPAPVLPPRRVAAPALPSGPPLPPPRHPPLPPRSASPPKPSSFSTHIAHPQHITSTLMKQSLQASKTGQWLKQGQAKLEQERVLQVLRSTSTTPRPAFTAEPADYISASGYGSASDDGSRGGSGGGRGRAPPSIPPSASSLEQVALASPPTSLHRAFEDAYREREPPPMHPDRADQNRRSAPASVSSRTSASSGSGSRSGVRASPERIKNQGSPEREREKPPRPPPKPRSLTSHAASSSSSLSSASPFSASASPFQSVSTHPASSSGSPSPFDSPSQRETQTQTQGHRLTRSASLRPSPAPPTLHSSLANSNSHAASSRPGRVRPESVHALLGGLGARLKAGVETANANIKAGESPFGDPDPVRRAQRREEREGLVAHTHPSSGSASSSRHSSLSRRSLHSDQSASRRASSPPPPHNHSPSEEDEDESDSGSDYHSDPDSCDGDGEDADGGWVGVRRFQERDSDLESPDSAPARSRVGGSSRGGDVGGKSPSKRKQPPRRDTLTPRTQTLETMERDSLKWPVDVEGEGWRPL